MKALLLTDFVILDYFIFIQARNNYDIGNYAAADSASRSARAWSIAGALCGCLWLILVPVIIVIVWICLPDYDPFLYSEPELTTTEMDFYY